MPSKKRERPAVEPDDAQAEQALADRRPPARGGDREVDRRHEEQRGGADSAGDQPLDGQAHRILRQKLRLAAADIERDRSSASASRSAARSRSPPRRRPSPPPKDPRRRCGRAPARGPAAPRAAPPAPGHVEHRRPHGGEARRIGQAQRRPANRRAVAERRQEEQRVVDGESRTRRRGKGKSRPASAGSTASD